MTQEDWGDIDSIPKSRGVPPWFWFCGGGCLLVVVALVALAAFGFRAAKKATDADLQWTEVASVLPFDERPEGYDLKWGWQLWFEFYTFEETDGDRVVVLFRLPESASVGDVREEMLANEEIEAGTVLVQGRELEAWRAASGTEQSFPFGQHSEASVEAGPRIFVNLTPEGAAQSVVMILARGDEDSERITDEEVVEFLAPFHVGPDRSPVTRAEQDDPTLDDEGPEPEQAEEEQADDGDR